MATTLNPLRRTLLVILLLPAIAHAQFGPKKKDLQQKIDSIKTVLDYHNYHIENLLLRDSVFFQEMKRLTGAQKDLSVLLSELNAKVLKLTEENERINKENKALRAQNQEILKKLEINEILIKEVIGDDSASAGDNPSALEEEEPETEREPEVIKDMNFAEFANDFISTVKSEGENGLKPYLSEEKYFYYLSKPAFMVSVSQIRDASELSEDIPWKMALESFKKSRFSFQEGEKPRVNCEMADLYDKLGCYGGLEENFDKISKSLLALKEFSPDDPLTNETGIEGAREIEKQIVSYIFSTDGHVGFYFIKKDGDWLLYCIDIEDPCSA